MDHIVKIISIDRLTHNVKQIRVEKPEGYSFVPGQATEVSINLPEWKEEKRPFTFTCLQDKPYLEFVIKSYHDHSGVTHQVDQLRPGNELIISDVWGAISYQGEGYFIAGGAGITPFIAILRSLHEKNQLGNNQLFFSNRTKEDIILHEELVAMLGDKAVFIITDEPLGNQKSVRVNKEYLQEQVKDFSKRFYICGPDPMIAELNDIIVGLGAKADAVVFEK
jgi:ferredoxin-NADP reductase